MRRDCPQRQGSQGIGTVQSQSSLGQARTQFVPSHPSAGQRDQHQYQGAAQAPFATHIGQRDQGMGRGRGRGQGSRAETLGTQERVYAITPQTELVDQSVIQGMFMLSCLCAKILFDSGASHSFVAASSVDVLGLEVETLDEPLHVSSPLGIKVRIDHICRDCELEISGILFMVDLRVMDISDFDVILGMDWLTAHWVVIDCDSRRITAYTRDGIRVTFQGEKHDALPRPCTTPGGVDS